MEWGAIRCSGTSRICQHVAMTLSTITNIYKNLQIVRSQFFTDKEIFIYIRSNLNIYWFISIQICCQ